MRSSQREMTNLAPWLHGDRTQVLMSSLHTIVHDSDHLYYDENATELLDACPHSHLGYHLSDIKFICLVRSLLIRSDATNPRWRSPNSVGFDGSICAKISLAITTDEGYSLFLAATYPTIVVTVVKARFFLRIT
jgi:hypothetical protein